jgi:hypothetical protein
MKSLRIKTVIMNVTICLLALCITAGCEAQQIPSNYQGAWKMDSVTLVLRKKVGWMKYDFSKFSVPVQLIISSNGLASGFIGDATFTAISVSKNRGNPETTGIAYKVQCGLLGKITDRDQTGTKELELWVKPIKQSGVLVAEVRLIDGWDTFPMGECVLHR